MALCHIAERITKEEYEAMPFIVYSKEVYDFIQSSACIMSYCFYYPDSSVQELCIVNGQLQKLKPPTE